MRSRLMTGSFNVCVTVSANKGGRGLLGSFANVEALDFGWGLGRGFRVQCSLNRSGNSVNQAIMYL